jgi:CHAT domain-containing protein
VVTPSLTIQALLWERRPELSLARQAGLVVAVSDFEDRRPPLPEVRREAAWMSRRLAPDGRGLVEAQANWENLSALAQSPGLDRFAFWHIASHAFHDAHTGRLGGIALANGDLWLNQIAELAPLPPLVSVSGCCGLQSRWYAGDEPLGLPSACLAAGAQQVVGSLWPVRDHRAAAVMIDFYQHWWAGVSAPQALALAQRAAAQADGADLTGWGGFLCAGA